MTSGSKLRKLHIGAPIKYDHKLYERLESQFDILRLSLDQLQRQPFMGALEKRDYKDFEITRRSISIQLVVHEITYGLFYSSLGKACATNSE